MKENGMTDFEKIDQEIIRKFDRSVRRNTRKKDNGQDRTRTRIERSKKAYNRKNKHNDKLIDMEND